MKNPGIPPKMQKELDRLLLEGAAAGSLLKVKQALQKGANINGKDESHWTALHAASYYQNAKLCKFLLEAGAQVNMKTADGATPLLIAASIGSVEVAEMLLEADANANAEDSIGITPLMGAAERGNAEMASLLLRWGADPYAKSRDKSAMDFALSKNLPEVAAAIEAQMLDLDVSSDRNKRRMRVM